MKFEIKFRTQSLYNGGPVTTVQVEGTDEENARVEARKLYGQRIDIVSAIPKGA